MGSFFDVRLNEGLVWAAARGLIDSHAGQSLARQACVLAHRSNNWRILFDLRLAVLAHDPLALNRHAEVLHRLGLPQHSRMALLCRWRTSECDYWEQLLNLTGFSAAVFMDGAQAMDWLREEAAVTPGGQLAAAELSTDDTAGRRALS